MLEEENSRVCPRLGGHGSEFLGMSKYTFICNKESLPSTQVSPGMTWQAAGFGSPRGGDPDVL